DGIRNDGDADRVDALADQAVANMVGRTGDVVGSGPTAPFDVLHQHRTDRIDRLFPSRPEHRLMLGGAGLDTDRCNHLVENDNHAAPARAFAEQRIHVADEAYETIGLAPAML